MGPRITPSPLCPSLLFGVSIEKGILPSTPTEGRPGRTQGCCRSYQGDKDDRGQQQSPIFDINIITLPMKKALQPRNLKQIHRKKNQQKSLSGLAVGTQEQPSPLLVRQKPGDLLKTAPHSKPNSSPLTRPSPCTIHTPHKIQH